MDITMPAGYSLSNAAGTCKLLTDVQRLAPSAVTEILVGTIARPWRKGNQGDNYYRDEDGSTINSMGVKSYGYNYYAQHLPHMVEIAHQNNKKISVSILPFQDEDMALLCRLAMLNKVDAIEIDAGCGNLWSGGKQKRILSYDLEQLQKLLLCLLELRMESRHPLQIRVKLAPYLDHVLMAEAAALIGSLGTPSMRVVIVTANAQSGAYMFKREGGILVPAIGFGNHLGGFGGDPYRAVALGQIAQFRQLLPNHPLVGVGGISTGEHIWEYLQFRVEGVQVGSAYYHSKDPEIFSRIVEELSYCPRIPKK